MSDQWDFSGAADRRTQPRKAENVRVWADPGGVLSVVDCRITNISEDGAQIEPVKNVEMPDAFTLQIDRSRNVGDAEVVWREEGKVGVRFAKPAAKP